MPPGVSAHVREATSSSVVAFTLTASSVTESARLLTQALNAVQALEPDDADKSFVAACALERVAMPYGLKLALCSVAFVGCVLGLSLANFECGRALCRATVGYGCLRG